MGSTQKAHLIVRTGEEARSKTSTRKVLKKMIFKKEFKKEKTDVLALSFLLYCTTRKTF